MLDGEAQIVRDEKMKSGDSTFVVFQKWLYSYNAFEEAEKTWQSLVSEDSKI